MILYLKPGDIFCTRNPMLLGRVINFVQKFFSADNESRYSHSGIVCNSDGTTFESLSTIRFSKLDAYVGKQIIIGRHERMTLKTFNSGMKAVKKHVGQIYPYHRLFLHLFRPAAKYISTGGFPLCSELVCKFLYSAKFVDAWKGKNPDDVADMIRRWKEWEIVYEGILT